MSIDRVNINRIAGRQSLSSKIGERLPFILEAANVGMWEWTVDTNEVRWSENLEAIHGLPPGTFDGTFEGFFRDVHPEDRQTVLDQIELAVNTCRDYHVEYRRIGKDSKESWIEARGKMFHDDSGRPVRMVGICVDITDRKRADKGTAHLAAIVTHSDDAIISKTLDGIITSFNAAAERMYGYRAEEVIGRPISILMPHDRADEFSSIVNKLRRGKHIDHYETIRRRKDGSLFNVSVTVSPARDGEGNLVGASAIARDITDRKRFEQDLQQSEERWRGLVSALPVAVYTVDGHGNIEEYNEEAVRIWGRRPEPGDTICGSWRIYLDGKLIPLEECPMGIALRTGESQHNREITVQRPDGTFATALVNIAVFKDDQGNLLGAVNTLLDITDRKQYEDQLQLSESRWRDLVSAIPAGVYVCDADGHITDFNSQAAELWGRKPEPGDRICGSLRMWKPDGRPLPHEECPMATVLSTGEAIQSGEVIVERPDGARVTVLVNISPLHDTEGRVIGAVNCFQDITARKRNENLLHQRLAQLRILYELSNAVGKSSAVERVCHAALDGLEQALGADRAAILLYDHQPSDDTPVMRFVAWRGLSDGYRAAVEGHSPWSPDETDPKPVVIDDAAKHELGDLRKVVLDEGIGALGFFPLVHKGRLLGKFMVYFNSPRRLSEEEVRLGETIAGQIAYAIERRNSEAALHRREQEFRALAEHSPDIIVRFDRNLRHLYINPAITEATGLPPEVFIGRTKHEIGMDPAHCDRWERACRACFETGEPQELEFDYPSPDGTRCFHTRVMPEAGVDDATESVLAVSRDITERKKIEQSLRRSEKNLTDFFDNGAIGLHWVNADGIIIRANRSELEMLGYDEHEYVGRRIADFHVDQPVIEAILQRLRRGETLRDFPARLWHKDGSIRHVTINSSALFEDGRFVHTRCFTRDVTEQRNAEEELSRQFAQLDAIYAGAPVGLAFVDTDLRYVRVNEAMAAFNDRPIEEHLGRTGREVIGEQVAPLEEILRQVIATGKPVKDVEFRFAMPSQPDVERDWLASCHPVHDGSGKCIGVNAIVQDITARKRNEEALTESAGRLQAIVETAVDGIITIDERGTIESFNPAAERIFGFEVGEIIGCNVKVLMPEPYHGEHDQYIANYLRSGERKIIGIGREVVGRRKDGSTFPMELGVSETNIKDGRRLFTGLVRDITERKNAERQIRLMNETLEERVKERTTQLRMLARRLTQAEQEERRRLARILHDDLQQLLVASAMRTEQLAQRHDDQEVSAAAWQVHDLIQQSIQSARSLTSEICPPVLYDGGLAATLPWLVRRMEQRHDLNVNLEIDESAEPADEETRIALYLTARELLFNIAKYAKTDEAFVSLSHRDGEWVCLVVEDRGVGFDTSHIERSEEGGGFGLFSLRERAELFGGRMVINSEYGEGTRIEFELPLRSVGEPQQAARLPFTAALGQPLVDCRRQHADNQHRATNSHRDPRTRILLVDDHQIVREGIAGILAEHADMEVIAEAVDGRQAVELAREHRPDLVIMDITMPEMNGVEATRRITRWSSGVVVIGLSMHDSPDMARAMKDAGAARVLVKDGPAEALIEAIREVACRTAVNGR